MELATSLTQLTPEGAEVIVRFVGPGDRSPALPPRRGAAL
jgi:hypothetical protein